MYYCVRLVVQVIVVMSDSELNGPEFESCDRCWKKDLKHLTRAYIHCVNEIRYISNKKRLNKLQTP